MSYSIVAQLHNIEQSVLDKILAQLSEAKKNTILRMIQDTDEYVPYSTGRLSRDVKPVFEPDGILYEAPYAEFAYELDTSLGVSKVYNTSVHPLAQGNWFDAAFEKYSEEWTKYFVEEVLKNVNS